MGVLGSFFEPQAFNFGNLDIFLRCSNDISTIFRNFLMGTDLPKMTKPLCPSNPEVHGLLNKPYEV